MITTELTYLDYPVMIDLETAGLSPNAPIAAIGAVRFNPEGGPTVGPNPEFYVAVNLVGQTPPDASTMYWWMKQSDEARAAFCEGEKGVPLAEALWMLHGWLLGQPASLFESSSEFRGEVWVRGDRDSVWLDEAYRRIGEPLPYKYNMVRDQRTLVKFAEERGVEMPFNEGVGHNALADAKYQVACLQTVFRAFPHPEGF